MSIEDRPKKDAVESESAELSETPSTPEDRPSLSPDPEERDALLALLLDESEPPPVVAPREPDSQIEHSAAFDIGPVTTADAEASEEEAPIVVDEPPDEEEAEVEIFELPSSPKLIIPELRQFSTDEETLVYTPDPPVSGDLESEATEDEIVVIEEEASEPLGFSAPISLPDERPAGLHLEDAGRREDFLARAQLIEAEARLAQDPRARARGLLLAAELFVMTGDEARADELASLAREAAPDHPLLHRYSRRSTLTRGDFEAALASLEAEEGEASTPESRSHLALLASEIARVCLFDAKAHRRWLDRAHEAHPSDSSAQLAIFAHAIANDEPLPELSLSETVASAARSLARYRRIDDVAEPADSGPVDLLFAARRAFRERDRDAAVLALEAFAKLPGFEGAASWLASAILAASPSAESKTRAAELIEGAAHGPDARLAHRWLAARALEARDSGRLLAAIAEPSSFDPVERLALAALASADVGAIEVLVADALGDAEIWPLAAGVASAIAPADLPARAEWLAGEPEAQARVRLARLIVAKAPISERREAVRTLEASGSSLLGAALLSELDLAEGRLGAVAEYIEGLPLAADAHAERNRALLAGLLYELAGIPDRAHARYEDAKKADPALEAAMRAALETSPEPAAFETSLAEAAEDVSDPVQASFLLLEAALRSTAEGDPSLLERAHELTPDNPFAAWVGEAESHSDPETRLEWLRRMRNLSEDPIERARLLVREARIVEESDPERAASLLSKASQARPSDIALRELLERKSPEPLSDRATYWAARAELATGQDKARFSLLAALEFEMLGDPTSASRQALLAMDAGEDQLSPLAWERSEGPARIADRYLEEARTAEDPVLRREAYERLAHLDEQRRGDSASAALFRRSILEDDPGHLPSLRKLEHQLITEGREAELEPILSKIALALRDPETSSHAMVAARLRLRASPSASIRDLILAASDVDDPSLWSLRMLDAVSREEGDHEGALLAAQSLAERTTRPLERATLLLRAAEAALSLEDDAKARELLERSIELEPSHPVALPLLAEVLARLGDTEGAARAYESLAQASRVDAHRLDAHLRAASLYLDRADDKERGKAALEAAAAIDPAHPDVLQRLRELHTDAGDLQALASLLAQRLRAPSAPEERAEIQVERARLFSQMGDLEEAKQALDAALEASPHHAEALRTLVDFSTRDEDWKSVERGLSRLLELATSPEEEANLHAQLGDLHREHLADPVAAEAAYLAVLEREPESLSARERLVEVYGQLGEGAKALELQQYLLDSAAAAEEKKRRTLELAAVHELVMGDPRKAEATLEALRKQFPADREVLGALVSLLERDGRDAAARMLLDRTASDARRALSTGRFEPNLFAVLATVAHLREKPDAAKVAEASLWALEGRALEITGGGLDAAEAQFDEWLAPELLTPAFRALLSRTGELLDAAVPFDLHSIRATPLRDEHPELSDEIRALSAGFGLEIEAFSSPALGHVCVPARSSPAQIVLGMPLVQSSEEAVRRFLILRALKILSAKAAGFARTAPVDLYPLATAYLQSFIPGWEAHGADSDQVAVYAERIAEAKPSRLDDDIPALALEVAGMLGSRASSLNTVVNTFGNRTALLAIGDPMAALFAIAWASGRSNGPPPSGRERITWVGRNAEARDVVVFSVGDAYAKAREKLDLG